MKVTGIVILLFISTFSFSQWKWQHQLPQGNNLNKITFVNDSVGYAVGNRRVIIKTIDCGNTWAPLYVDIQALYTEDFIDVYFANENVGYILGKFSFYRTNNGGVTWSTVYTPFGYINTAMYFIDENTGIIIGEDGKIAKTTDGGQTWVTKPVSLDLKSVVFTNPQTGYYCRNMEVFKTIDAGETWFLSFHIWYNTFNDIFFIDENNGYIVGNNDNSYTNDGRIFKTNNSGATWNIISEIPNYELLSVYFHNYTDGFLFAYKGDSGYVFKTTDAGITWDIILSKKNTVFKDIYFTNYDTGFLVGGNRYEEITSFYKTSDAGNNWSDIQFSLTSSRLWDISFPDADTGYIIAEDGDILKTTNGGQNWFKLSFFKEKSISYRYIYFMNTDTGFVSGLFSRIYKTTDGGLTWSHYSFNFGSVLSMFFVDDNIGYVCGTSGDIYKTINCGTTWTAFASGATEWLYSIFFTDANNGYAVGQNETALKTVDGGMTWIVMSSLENLANGDNFYNVFFENTDTGYVGHYKTTDAGITWDTCCGNYPAGYGIFVGNGVCYSFGSGLIYKTTDNWDTWSTQQINLGGSPSNMIFTNNNKGYVIGEFGQIFSTDNGGAIQIPIITDQPSDKTVCLGDNSVFVIKSLGDSVLTYLWQYNNGGTWSALVNDIPTGAVYSNQNSDSLSISGINIYGTYQYRCIVSNVFGSDTSNITTLSVNPYLPVDIIISSSDDTICVGSNVVFNATTLNSGTNPIFQWKVNNCYVGSNDSTLSYSDLTCNSNVICTLSSSSSCALSDTSNIISVIVNSNYVEYNLQYIHNGGGYSINGHVYTNTGIYYDSLNTQAGCDSIIITDLHLCPDHVDLDSVNGGVNDTLFVTGSSVILDAGGCFQNYHWSNGLSSQTINVHSSGWYSVTVSDNSFSAHDSIYVMTNTSAPFLSNKNGINVYPNPNNGKFIIQTNKNLEINEIGIYNVFGSEIRSISINKTEKNVSIDLPGSEKGLYFLKISSDKEIFIVKVIIQ